MTGSYTTTEEYAVLRSKRDLSFRDGDRTEWRVEIRLPGASNAMVVFHHPHTSGFNRYAWYQWRGPEARSVTARIPVERIVETLSDATIALLFRRSAPVSVRHGALNLASGSMV